MSRLARIAGMVVVSVAVSLGMSQTAWATFQNFQSFKKAYPGKDAKAYSCRICHEGAIGNATNLNAYGKELLDLKGDEGAKALTEDDYRAVEQEDADGDGASNLDEIEAGTDPGDATSTPAPTPSQ